MKANVGDYLVVKGTTTERHDQHAEIIEVRSQDGSPPYVVRWLVTGHEATVYPGSTWWSSPPPSIRRPHDALPRGPATPPQPAQRFREICWAKSNSTRVRCVGQHGQLTRVRPFRTATRFSRNTDPRCVCRLPNRWRLRGSVARPASTSRSSKPQPRWRA